MLGNPLYTVPVALLCWRLLDFSLICNSNVGTCSRQTNIVLNDDHTIESVEVIGGCNGNLKGISRLLKGMKAEDAIARMEGTTCGPRPTSCPDQIARNLKKALAEM